ncbi:MAG TPA: hypothetical protein PKM25_02705, partial [Candidatus Ozemobacteraceae bacterium]|mgnify:CR=1 FL=1|nr:hypothetical protein [Candidatus Ozemobacteraceae bacterium]
MFDFLKKPLLIACAAGLLACAADARTAPTAISSDDDPLHDDAFSICAPVTTGGGIIMGTLGKMLNIPKSVKINEIGFLFNALGMDAIQVTAGDPKGFHANTVLPYLRGSKEMQDSLKLRRTARQLKYQVVSKMLKDVPADKLSDEQKQAITDFLSQQAGSSLVILEKSPLPSFMPTPGPCMIPLGMERVEAKTGKRLGLETSGICVLDIESGGQKLFSVKDALDNDTLDLVLGHENAHGIMFDLYGRTFGIIQRVSTNGHDAPYITDLGMAYIEGWAEAFEAVYGPANPKLAEKDRKKYNISEFLYGRQDPIRRDRYIWARPTGKKTGVLKNGLQLVCTEGVVAGQFYDILTSRAITGAYEKCISVMLLTQPQNYADFIREFVNRYPDDQKVVYRILLEGMNYVTMDRQAAPLYRSYYEAKLAYVAKKIDKETFEKARKAFTDFKEGLFGKAMKGADPFANVGPQLWFSGSLKLEGEKRSGSAATKVVLAQKFGSKKDNVWNFNMDLNTITAKMLIALGASEETAAKIIADRETRGFFTGDPLKILESSLGSEFKQVMEKSSLKPYQPVKAGDSKTQLTTLYPEDFDQMKIGGGD